MCCAKYTLMSSRVNFCVYSINHALFFSTNLCVWPSGLDISQECKVGCTVNSWQLPFLIVSAWHWAFGCWSIHFKDIYLEEEKKGISRKLQSIWPSAAFRGWLEGPAVHMKRRNDLKGSCWSSVLQIKSKQALCNSLLCFYFFLVLYCCLSFPNTINVPASFIF